MHIFTGSCINFLIAVHVQPIWQSWNQVLLFGAMRHSGLVYIILFTDIPACNLAATSILTFSVYECVQDHTCVHNEFGSIALYMIHPPGFPPMRYGLYKWLPFLRLYTSLTRSLAFKHPRPITIEICMHDSRF